MIIIVTDTTEQSREQSATREARIPSQLFWDLFSSSPGTGIEMAVIIQGTSPLASSSSSNQARRTRFSKPRMVLNTVAGNVRWVVEHSTIGIRPSTPEARIVPSGLPRILSDPLLPVLHFLFHEEGVKSQKRCLSYACYEQLDLKKRPPDQRDVLKLSADYTVESCSRRPGKLSKLCCSGYLVRDVRPRGRKR